MTIIYTTHYMEEVERLCETIAIIDAGKIIVQGTKDELRTICNLKEVVVLEIESVSNKTIDQLQKITGLKIIQKSSTISIECNPSKDLEQLLKSCGLLKISIKNIDIKKSNLESVFLQLTGKKLRD